MMKVVPLLCIVCGLLSSARALDRQAFTFTRYDLNVRVEPDQQRVGVRGKVTLRNDSNTAQNNAVLQISSTLNWSSLQIDGKPAQFFAQPYTSDIDHTGSLSEAVVTLPRPVGRKQAVDIEVGYEGVIPQDTTRLTRIGVPPDTAKHSDWDQIGKGFTAVRGIGYVAWYPIATEAANLSDPNSVPEEVGRWKERERDAEMTIKFSQLADSTAGSPKLYCDGTRNARTTGEMGRGYLIEDECRFSALGAVVPVFVLANYPALEDSYVEISYPADRKSRADDYALAVEQVAPFVERWFGDHREASASKAIVVDLPDPEASPFESGNMLLMPLTANDTILLLSALRQLTHLIFPSPRLWISEGLPLFAQVAYLEREKGRSAAIAYLQSHRNVPQTERPRPLDGNSQEDSAAQDSLINSSDEFLVQTKAMSVWWMLRDIVGEEHLITALHDYKASEDTNAYYMQKLIEAQAHRDLAWFFDDWVYRRHDLPDFHISSLYPRELTSGGYIVTVTIENKGDTAAEVPVTVRAATTESSARLVVRAHSSASVRIELPAMPQEAVVNDGSVPERDMSNNTFRIHSDAK